MAFDPVPTGQAMKGLNWLPKSRPYIIAEAGVNHGGDVRSALRLVDAAAKAGADAVKFQTFQAERLVTLRASKARYQVRTTGGKESQFEMLKRLELSPGDHRSILARCRKRGIEFMSTPFDEGSADFLAGLGMRIFKVASGELTNHPLLENIARKRLPVILSTGMSDLSEVAAAVAAIRDAGNPPLVLLHCVSDYPAAPEDANLRAMAVMARRFSVPVGFSDHTAGLEVSIAAAALGAAVIEKHFTLDRSLPGPDQASSLEPGELRDLVRCVRNAAAALGDGRKLPQPSEADTRNVARRSLVLARAAKAGTALTPDLLAAKRPGTGIPPGQRAEVLGRTLRRSCPADTVLSWDLLK